MSLKLCLSVFGIKTYVVLSGSMEPSLKIGDLIIIRSCTKEDIQIGDIISFEVENKIITHRIIDIIDGKYKTKGDNNNVEDDNIVEIDKIKGKLVFSFSKIGKLIIIQNKFYINIIFIVIFIMLIYEIKNKNKLK